MPDFAFIVFGMKPAAALTGFLAKCGFLKTRMGSALFFWLNKKNSADGIEVLKLKDGTEILKIGMPFDDSLVSSLNISYLERRVSKICREYGCVGYFAPASVRSGDAFRSSFALQKSRSVVYRSLLIPILDVIYKDSGLMLDELDMVFIPSCETDVLTLMVRQIEPFMKYVYVAAADRQRVEDQLADICEESGLSVFVSNDFTYTLGHANLIICPGNGNGSKALQQKIRPDTIVINFSDEGKPFIRGDFCYISGVIYQFPDSEFTCFSDDIRRCFGRSELTEILMALKAGLSDTGDFSEIAVKNVLNAFYGSGCRITGFMGRRGQIGINEIRQLL